MTIKHQIEIETITFVLFAALAASFFVWQNNQKSKQQLRISVPVVDINSQQNIVSPVVAETPKIDTASQVSPDGTKKLSMKATHNTDKSISYVFTTSDDSGANEREIYATASASEKISIPFNAWSPDNKYVFIVKNGTQAMAFKASGEPVMKDQAYFDVSSVFINRIKTNTISEVTGWASPTLLVINTLAQDGSKGTSYWFEIPSQAIIPLSTQF